MKGISIFLSAVLILIGAVAANAIPIKPKEVVASSTQPSSVYQADNLINDSGLDAAGLLHDNDKKNMWLNFQEGAASTLPYVGGRN